MRCTQATEFLSESPEFAEQCTAAGLKFIGPPAEVIRRMGSKAAAKELAKQAGVPVVPGSDGPLKNIRQARALADKVGYPVLLKSLCRRRRPGYAPG